METSWVLDQLELLAAVILPAVLLAGAARRHIPDGRCAHCDYDLAGLRADAPCPECGGRERGRHGRIWCLQTWGYSPRRALCCLGLVPVALGAALAMPIVIESTWHAAHNALSGAPALPTQSYGEMHICFSLAYIGAFAMATVPLARLSVLRGFLMAVVLITLGAGVQLSYLAADSITGHLWWTDAINRQRFVFTVFALLLASLAVAAVDPALRAVTPRAAP